MSVFIMPIDIAGLDKAEVLLALWKHAKPLKDENIKLTIDQCRESLKNKSYFDNYFQRTIKCSLADKDVLKQRLYNEYNGKGRAEEAIESIRKPS